MMQRSLLFDASTAAHSLGCCSRAVRKRAARWGIGRRTASGQWIFTKGEVERLRRVRAVRFAQFGKAKP